jgi:hypothetical protein
MAPPADIKKIAEDVVRRARAGDQNAMGLIAETRESSLHPEGQRARDMMRAILTYCEKNPVSESEPAFPEDDTFFGAETANSLGKLKTLIAMNKTAPTVKHDKGCIKEVLICLNDLANDPNNEAAKVAALILANGPGLIPPRLEFMKSLISDPQAQAVFHSTVIGSLGNVPAPVRAANADAIHVGKIVGRARVMQMVRNSMRAIKFWCSRTHAEIGLEDDEADGDSSGSDFTSARDEEPSDEGGSYDESGGDPYDNGGVADGGAAPAQSGGGGGGGGSSPDNSTSAAPTPMNDPSAPSIPPATATPPPKTTLGKLMDILPFLPKKDDVQVPPPAPKPMLDAIGKSLPFFIPPPNDAAPIPPAGAFISPVTAPLPMIPIAPTAKLTDLIQPQHIADASVQKSMIDSIGKALNVTTPQASAPATPKPIEFIAPSQAVIDATQFVAPAAQPKPMIPIVSSPAISAMLASTTSPNPKPSISPRPAPPKPMLAYRPSVARNLIRR